MHRQEDIIVAVKNTAVVIGEGGDVLVLKDCYAARAEQQHGINDIIQR
jgi:hypothetical protein